VRGPRRPRRAGRATYRVIRRRYGASGHHAVDESAPDAWTEEGGWAGPRWGPPPDAGRRLDAKVWRLLLAAGVLLAVMMIVDIAIRG
jgi:hypothetical protein